MNKDKKLLEIIEELKQESPVTPIGIKGLVNELGMIQERISVMCDSLSAIHLTKNQMYHERHVCTLILDYILLETCLHKIHLRLKRCQQQIAQQIYMFDKDGDFEQVQALLKLGWYGARLEI